METVERENRGLDSRWRRQTTRGTEAGIFTVLVIKEKIADKTNHPNGRMMLWHKISEIQTYVHVAPSWWDWSKAAGACDEASC